MLKKDITYENFDGEKVTKTFYFHLSVPELLELETETEGGMFDLLQKVAESDDNREILEQFKLMILRSYGERDGDRHIKSEEISKAFTQTPAYETLYMELLTEPGAAEEFGLGIMPRDLAEKANKLAAQGERASTVQDVTGEEANRILGSTPKPPTPPSS